MLSSIIDFVSYSLAFFLLIFCGIYLTFRLKFFQIKGLLKSFRLIKQAALTKSSNKQGISSFQAASSALSATVGTGNIAGVAGAISIGGAGAVFWMWVSAILGMIIKYAEITLGILFRKKGEFVGGPMYYIKYALPKPFKFLSVVFSVFIIFSAFVTGNITQTNSAVTSFSKGKTFNLCLGITFSLIIYFVLKGGIKRIGKLTEKLVPIMAFVYIILCLAVILCFHHNIIPAFKMIFQGAFNPKSVTGGIVGSALKVMFIGASRGVFSNESGLGTSAIVHSSCFDANAKTQGLFGVFEVFVDTILICTLTALTILCTFVKIDYGRDMSSSLVKNAFSCVFLGKSDFLYSAMMCIFGISSVIGWSVYLDLAINFLKLEKYKTFFFAAYSLSCVVGATCNTAFAWKLSAFLNGIILICNLPSILYLSDNLCLQMMTNRKVPK